LGQHAKLSWRRRSPSAKTFHTTKTQSGPRRRSGGICNIKIFAMSRLPL
jgi:hypothetical protein